MTGKELIIYILENNLENEVIFEEGLFIGCITEDEAAVKFNVAVPTIRAWYEIGYLPGVRFGEIVYVYKNAKDPRNKNII